MNITLEQLQKEVSEWSNRNFPSNLPHHPLLGLVEEHGEIHDAQTLEDCKDAVSDSMIYLADYCSRNGLLLRDNGSPMENGLRWLCHYHLKGEQGIRYKPDEIQALKQDQVYKILANLRFQAEVDGFDFWEALTSTWNKVKQRDWQANPINAASV